MKTTLAVILVLSAVPALAQTTRFTKFSGAPLEEVIKYYQGVLNKDILIETKTPERQYTAEAQPTLDGLKVVLAPELTATDVGSYIRISRKEDQVPQQAAPVAGPANEGQASLDAFLACVHSGPDAGQTSRYIFCNQSSQSAFVPRPIYTAQAAYPTVAYSPYGYGGYASMDPYAYYWFGPCRSFMPRQEQPVRCVQAAVTFNVKQHYLNEAILRIDDHDFGTVDQFATRPLLPDRKLYLGADKEHVIEIIQFTESGESESIIKRIQPETIRLSGGRPIKITVSEEQFARTPYGRKIVPNHGETVDGKDLVMGKSK